ncbi:MAG: type II 3-dehydroquinate dehydratase [Alphaproteobacteria bacterium]|jgi:3-dehydroquinate dehydratase-2|tara:strand:- start:7704 stop:8144 length:441 start_codon:yes stop_codon:yes gene_type:complete
MKIKKKIIIINGPNLNLLGKREPELYGKFTLKDIEKMSKKRGEELDIAIEFVQSNDEGQLINWIQESRNHDGLIINAGAYTHTSIAIQDAMRLLECPAIEVHISNIFKREDYRHLSYVAPVATGSIVGLGAHGYVLAIEAINKLTK